MTRGIGNTDVARSPLHHIAPRWAEQPACGESAVRSPLVNITQQCCHLRAEVPNGRAGNLHGKELRVATLVIELKLPSLFRRRTVCTVTGTALLSIVEKLQMYL